MYDLTSDNLDNSLEPNANQQSLKSLEIIQEAGQIVFVPSGWYHQVWNLVNILKLQHNNFFFFSIYESL